jgi:3-oxoacyl-[acyl-carrier-protein] synthase II
MRIGLATGTSIGDPNHVYAGSTATSSNAAARGAFFTSAEYSGHAATGHVAIELGFTGPTQTISTGCASGHEVLNWAYRSILGGQLDAVLAGSADSVLDPSISPLWTF